MNHDVNLLAETRQLFKDNFICISDENILE